MAGLIDIKTNDREIRKLTRQLKQFPAKAPQVLNRAINKSITSARAQMAREVSGDIKVRVTTVKKTMIVKRATIKNLFATITLSVKRIPLIEFAAKELKKRGVSYKIKKTGKRERAPRAFIATMKSGHRGVFHRKPKTRGSDQLVKRLPIGELRGPSPQKVFRSAAEMVRAVTELAAKNMEKFIAQQIAFILKK